MDKQALIINVLALIPAVVEKIPAAIDLYNRMVAALKDDKITQDEWDALVSERDSLLDSIIAGTTPA